MKIENIEIVKSPLRYPGGKSKAILQILKYIPKDVKTIVSPFFGGGSIELACSSLDYKVFGYEIFEPLVLFWQCLFEDNVRLSEYIRKYYPLSKEDFKKLQKSILSLTDKYEIASAFFVLNRSSFSGLTLSGGISPNHPRFNESSINRIENFKSKNVTVEKLDFKDSILKHENDFLFCDPPYLINSNLYGNKGDGHINFDHEGLFNILNNRKNWILCYNNCYEIKELYKNYKTIYPEWKYGFGNDKQSKEILIINR